jgi:hypothetical protein
MGFRWNCFAIDNIDLAMAKRSAYRLEATQNLHLGIPGAT